MKKLNLLATFALVMLATACHKQHHTTVSTNNNGSYMKLEFAGKISLTQDQTGIEGMSRDAYIKYKKEDESLIAERNADGRITYEVDGGDKQFTLNDTGKRLLGQAITQIIKTGNYNR